MLFRSKLIGKCVDIEEYGMTTVDLKELGYRDEPFVLAKDVTQVFYMQDMSSKLRKDKSRNKSSFLGAGDETKRHIILVNKKKLWESTMSQMKANTTRLKT